MGLPKSCWRNNFTSLHPSNTFEADFTGVFHCSGLLYNQGSICPCTASICPMWLFGYFFAFFKMPILLNKMEIQMLALLCKGITQDEMCCLAICWQCCWERRGALPYLHVFPHESLMQSLSLVSSSAISMLDLLSPSQLWSTSWSAVVVFSLLPIVQLLL